MNSRTPETIIRAPHLTEPEIAIMRAVGAVLRRVARQYRSCGGRVGEAFAKCVYKDGPGEDVRCDTCGRCICASCRGQSNWTWPGTPAPDGDGGITRDRYLPI